MKRFGTLLLVILLATITSFSSNICQKTEQDSIVSITSKQLKETNLIFVEHSKLLVENNLLLKQIENYKLDNFILVKSDSIKSLQIENYKELSSMYNYKLIQLESESKRKSKTIIGWKIGGVVVSFGLLLLLVLK